MTKPLTREELPAPPQDYTPVRLMSGDWALIYQEHDGTFYHDDQMQSVWRWLETANGIEAKPREDGTK
jgi:hypothetical protein